MDKKYYTFDEVAERWRIEPETLYRWRKAGKLMFYRCGRRLLISAEDLEAMERGMERK